MHEATKLQEAEYFYSQLIDPAQRLGFVYNLHALLNAARTVLVYAHEEIKASKKPGGQAWYQHWLTDPVIKFLRDTRHIDMHERPVGTNQTIHLQSAAVMVGRGGQTEHFRPPPTTTHDFGGWNGPEDAPTLCRRYLDELAKFIEDGQGKGFLTK